MPLLGDKGHAELLATWAEGTPLYNAVHDKRVKSVVMISAHHSSTASDTVHIQCDGPTAAGKMLFDYGGFPPEAYKVVLKNPSDMALSSRIASLLNGASIKAKKEKQRGYDHGCFVPLLGLKLPEAVNVVQVSICASFDFEFHRKMGEALRPLREEGVLIVGSGMTSHNMRAFRPRGGDVVERSVSFDVALERLVKANRLQDWEAAPDARFNHPQEEHLVPLFVTYGAGGTSNVVVERMTLMGCRCSNYIFY